MLGDSGAYPLSHAFRHCLRSHRHDRHEFVARITREDIHLTEFLANYAGNARQQSIAGSVSPLIIDLFEVVNVHTDQGQRFTIQALALGKSLLKHHVEAPRVWQFSKRIGQRAFPGPFKGHRVVQRRRCVLRHRFEQSHMFSCVGGTALCIQSNRAESAVFSD